MSGLRIGPQLMDGLSARCKFTAKVKVKCLLICGKINTEHAGRLISQTGKSICLL